MKLNNRNKKSVLPGKRQLAIAMAIAILPSFAAQAGEFDLSPNAVTRVDIDGAVGGVAIFADLQLQPTGTGVFQPFLDLDSQGKVSTGDNHIEHAYNTDGYVNPNNGNLALDNHRAPWNHLLQIRDLEIMEIEGVEYFGFVLDANEPGSDKSLISVDNIRIYTSASSTTPADVGRDATKLDNLGTLRWAMNDPLSTGVTPPDLNGFNVDQWVKLDAAQESVDGGGNGTPNGGSGQGDMVVYIPVSDFAGAQMDDYVWFYNLNGVHYTADSDLAAESGYEEWRAIANPNHDTDCCDIPPPNVPDGGTSLALLGLGLTALTVAAKRRKQSSKD